MKRHKRAAARLAGLALLGLLLGLSLAGCRRELTSETVVIPDAGDEPAASAGREPFAVKTIYRLPDAGTEQWLGWLSPEALLGTPGDAERGRDRSLEKFTSPYETGGQSLIALAGNESVSALSPDGRFVATAAQADQSIALALVALSGGQRTVVDQLAAGSLISRQAAWSDNSRYLSYLVWNADDSAAELAVYDTAQGGLQRYAFPGWQRSDGSVAVKLSDDGASALFAGAGGGGASAAGGPVDERTGERVDERANGQVDERVSEQASEGVGERVDRQVDERVSEQAGEGAGEQADRQVDERVSEQASEGVGERVTARGAAAARESVPTATASRESAPVAAQAGGETIRLAVREGDEFTVRYEHAASDGDAFAWINPSQFAFLDADGSLYTYDRRNESLTLLLGGIGQFRLSPDKKAIAYVRNEDTVYAGQLQGNNVLNEKTVYQGVIPSELIWSPDRASLLVSGWKPYNRTEQAPIVPSTRDQTVPAPAAPSVTSNILEFE